jgi:hypothetical protein
LITHLKSRFDVKNKIKVRFEILNHDPVEKFKSRIDWSGSGFQSRSWSRWEILHQGLMKKITSGSAGKFQTGIRLRISNQGLMKKLQSKSAGKFQIGIRLWISNQGWPENKMGELTLVMWEPPGKALLLFGGVGIPAGFATDHFFMEISGFGLDNAGAGGMKVIRRCWLIARTAGPALHDQLWPHTG